MDRGKHCGEEALTHFSSTNKLACTHTHADTSRCTCSNTAKRTPLQAHMPHDLRAHTLTHVARGDFSITASAKQSPERDVPCLSGKAFQLRFFFLNLFLSQLLDSCQVHNQKWHSTKQQIFPQWNFTGNDGKKSSICSNCWMCKKKKRWWWGVDQKDLGVRLAQIRSRGYCGVQRLEFRGTTHTKNTWNTKNRRDSTETSLAERYCGHVAQRKSLIK